MNRADAVKAYPELCLFIDGEWLAADGRTGKAVIDPATETMLGEVPVATTLDLDRAIAASVRSFDAWSRQPALARIGYISAATALLRERRAEWAARIALELGKPYEEALRETETACEMFDWAAQEARRIYGRIIPARVPDMRMMALPRPVGPVGAISGWNAPAITPSRKIAAALAAGCTIVLKPSEATPATALMIARCFDDAGLPPGVLNIVFGDPPTIGERLATDPSLRMLSFTGGIEVGKRLSALAGNTLKRTVFELGGHAPVLIFADCDIESAARAAAAAKFRNSGQICTSPTRFIVEAPAYAPFVDALAAAADALSVGDPFEKGVHMGPLQNPARLAAIQSLIADAKARGARVAAGVPLTARLASEEPFGALAMVSPGENYETMVREANRLPVGLAGYACTTSLKTAERLSRDIDVGTLAINHWTASLPETPFGGVRDSGTGSEGGIEGIAAFLQTRFVSILS